MDGKALATGGKEQDGIDPARGKFGGEATQLPAGHADTSSSFTASVELK